MKMKMKMKMIAAFVEKMMELLHYDGKLVSDALRKKKKRKKIK